MGSLARAAVAVLFVVVVLKESTGLEETLASYELNLLYIAFGFGALATYAWREELPSVVAGELELREDGPVLVKLVVAAVVTFWLFVVMATLDGPGFPQADQSLAFAGVFLLVLTYPAFHHRVGRLVRRNWPYLLAFAALFGVYLRHGSTYEAGSAVAAFPIAVGFLLVVNLFVVPRYVPIEDFLWVANRVSAAAMLLGLAAYVVGEYTAMGVPVALWHTTFSPPLLSLEVPFLQSVFGNPNAAGILAFVGTVAAVVELQRVSRRLVDDGHRPGPSGGVEWVESAPRLAVAAALLLVNGLGLYLTHSRAAMLAAGASGIVYLAYAGIGPDVVPRAVAGTAAVLVVALGAVAGGFLAVGSGGRFVLWSGGVEAILRSPTLVGEGLVETGPIIEPYVTDPTHRGSGVHNSYLTTTIRAGLVGGAAHVVLAVGSLVHALTVDRAVRGAPIALGLGFVVHQLFESYTLFQHSMGAILASLAAGYVIAAIRDARTTEADSPSESPGIADVFDGRGGRSSRG